MDSFISWVGGKKILRKKIIERFPSESEKYVEVFGGAAWVLFGKEPQKKEIYNDVNGELVNLFRMVKHHPEALQKELKYYLNSREEFFRQKRTEPEGLTEIQRAARMYFLIRASYASKVDTFGCGFSDVYTVRHLEAVHERLQHVQIENKNFREIIKKQDADGTLFYLDPPYHGTEKLYEMKDGFGEAEHEELAEILKNVKGKWVLSYNDDDYIRNLYKEYKIEAVDRDNNMSGTGKRFKEVIIKNW